VESAERPYGRSVDEWRGHSRDDRFADEVKSFSGCVDLFLQRASGRGVSAAIPLFLALGALGDRQASSQGALYHLQCPLEKGRRNVAVNPL